MCIYIYIYIYIKRESQRDADADTGGHTCDAGGHSSACRASQEAWAQPLM